ncbi:MAG: hypothetical protein K5872_21395 [Rhizobiaceae bacterium]|nr:hypothetical protein [Rhizobiaceae bacterium]MCV0408773.1 hypothetical protein [Rhizobiaceae bacterium]
MLYQLHLIAAARGDGLRAEFVELLSRASEAGLDPALVDIAALRRDGYVQAGSHPAGRLPQFLPGNVIDASDRFNRADMAHTTAAQAETNTEARTQG